MGVLLAFVVDRLDRRIKTTDTLEKEFGLPVLATIPRVRRFRVPEAERALRCCRGILRPIAAFRGVVPHAALQPQVLRVRSSDPHHRRHEWASSRGQDRHDRQSGRQPGSVRRSRRGHRSRPAPTDGASLLPPEQRCGSLQCLGGHAQPGGSDAAGQDRSAGGGEPSGASRTRHGASSATCSASPRGRYLRIPPSS